MNLKLVRVLFLTTLLINIAKSYKQCQKSLRWTLNGKTFPYDFDGKVKLVAFLKASCKFCKQQAKK